MKFQILMGFMILAGFSLSCSNKTPATPSGLAFVALTANSLSTLLGQSGPGSINGQFTSPWGIAVDGGGDIYVSDYANQDILKFDSNGNFLLKWGASGPATGQFADPSYIALDQGGDVYVADTFNYRIQVFDASGNYLRNFGGGQGTANGEFETLEGLVVDGQGNAWVADSYAVSQTGRVQEFNSSGVYTNQLYPPGSPAFGETAGLALDGSGYIYVLDAGNHRVVKFNFYGSPILQWGGSGSSSGQFPAPAGIAANGSRVYVTDSVLDRVQVFDTLGNYLFQWGTPGSGWGQYNGCEGLALGVHGEAYVADLNNHRVQEVSPLLTNVLGSPVIAPNPVKTGQSVVFAFVPSAAGSFSITVKDAQSQEVNQYQGQTGQGANQAIQWNLADSNGTAVPEGSYFVLFNIPGGSVTEGVAVVP